MIQSVEINNFISNIDLADIKFSNLPQKFTLDEYERSMSKVVNLLRQYREVRSIYQIGGIGHPGISDLDLLIILEDDTRFFQVPYRQIFDTGDCYRYMHGIFAMPVSVFSQRELLLPIRDLRLLFGVSVPEVTALTVRQRSIIGKIYAIEYMAMNLLNLILQFKRSRLKVRNTLCALHALVYDFQLLSGGSLSNDWLAYIERINILRRTWDFSATDSNSTSVKHFFNLCKSVVSSMSKWIDDCVDLLDKIHLPKTENLTVHFGTNGYLTLAKDDRTRITIQNWSWGYNFTKKLIISNISGLLRHISDFQQSFFAVVLWLPSSILQLLGGNTEGDSQSVFTRRAELLESYRCFMRHIHPEYSVFDGFRWYGSRSVKWRLIRTVNQHLCAPISDQVK